VRALLGSDPNCDKSGAAATQDVGMVHERSDMPGLSHFLEHMLFTGTEKYPSEGEYAEFIAQNGGSRNANTACNFTNYFLSIKPDKFQEGLDRFAQFFTAPLLTKDCISREINAVDSEFKMGFTQDWWRIVGMFHHMANPEHPWHVAVGNVQMLRDDPLALGVDLYEETRDTRRARDDGHREVWQRASTRRPPYDQPSNHGARLHPRGLAQYLAACAFCRLKVDLLLMDPRLAGAAVEDEAHRLCESPDG